MADFLLTNGHRTQAIEKRVSSFNTGCIEHLNEVPHKGGVCFIIHYDDVTDAMN